MGVNTSFSKEESKKQSIKPKGSSMIGKSVDMTAWEREEAYRENERTIKKLMVEVSRL